MSYFSSKILAGNIVRPWQSKPVVACGLIPRHPGICVELKKAPISVNSATHFYEN